MELKGRQRHAQQTVCADCEKRNGAVRGALLRPEEPQEGWASYPASRSGLGVGPYGRHR